MAGTIDHSSRAHALLSASGAHRWLVCTPSARLEEKAQTSGGGSTVYGEEGTLAHELADAELNHYLGKLDKRGLASERKRVEKELKKLLGEEHPYFNEMTEEVEKYVGFVIEEFESAKAATPDAILILEERVDYSHLVPEGFGTGDAIIIADGTMSIIDLKYGKGIQVFAKSNPQLMLYASGALEGLGLLFDIQEVNHVIVQPRMDHIDQWACSRGYLERWGEKVAKPAAEKAYNGEGDRSPGEHCKFCKVKVMCKALADHNLELAKHEFKDPDSLEIEDLVAVFEQTPVLLDWVKSVGDYLLQRALDQDDVPGYKAVEGRSQRRWFDEEGAIAELKKKKYKVKDIMVTKLAGIGHIEKLVGKSSFEDVVGPYVEKPEGKPALAPEEDKRPPLSLARVRRDFEEPLSSEDE